MCSSEVPPQAQEWGPNFFGPPPTFGPPGKKWPPTQNKCPPPRASDAQGHQSSHGGTTCRARAPLSRCEMNASLTAAVAAAAACNRGNGYLPSTEARSRPSASATTHLVLILRGFHSGNGTLDTSHRAWTSRPRAVQSSPR